MTNKEQKHIYKLSILVSRDGFSFCGQNKEDQLLLLRKNTFTEEKNAEQLLKSLQSFLEHNMALTAENIQHIKVIYANKLFSPVPTNLFEEKNLSNYLKFSIKLLKTDFVAYDVLENAGIHNVYVPFANINNYIFDTFGEFTYVHSTSVLIENALAENTEQKTVFINVFDTFFELCCVQENKLLFCNSFDFETPEDFIYYILFCFEQLELSQKETPVYISGNIHEDSENYKILKTYIQHVNFTATPAIENVKNTEVSQQLNHHNYTLLNSL